MLSYRNRPALKYRVTAWCRFQGSGWTSTGTGTNRWIIRREITDSIINPRIYPGDTGSPATNEL